jgi:hypothetical protein
MRCLLYIDIWFEIFVSDLDLPFILLPIFLFIARRLGSNSSFYASWAGALVTRISKVGHTE